MGGGGIAATLNKLIRASANQRRPCSRFPSPRKWLINSGLISFSRGYGEVSRMLANALAILRSWGGGAFQEKRNFDTWMRAATRTGRLGRLNADDAS